MADQEPEDGGEEGGEGEETEQRAEETAPAEPALSYCYSIALLAGEGVKIDQIQVRGRPHHFVPPFPDRAAACMARVVCVHPLHVCRRHPCLLVFAELPSSCCSGRCFHRQPNHSTVSSGRMHSTVSH